VGAPFPRGKCKTDEWMNVYLRLPEPGDYGHLTVRRPLPIEQTQM